MDPAVVLTGTANERRVGHHFGSVEISCSESAYIFWVALPSARRNCCKFHVLLIYQCAYIGKCVFENVWSMPTSINMLYPYRILTGI